MTMTAQRCLTGEVTLAVECAQALALKMVWGAPGFVQEKCARSGSKRRRLDVQSMVASTTKRKSQIKHVKLAIWLSGAPGRCPAACNCLSKRIN